MAPIVAGFGLAAVIVQLVYRTFVWQNAVVAAVPVLLFVGSTAVLGLAEAIDRTNRSWPAPLVAEVATIALVAAVLVIAIPELVENILGRVADFGAYIEAFEDSGVGETIPITETFGPVLGPLVLLGFSPFLGLPVVAWGVVRGWRYREIGWFVLTPYVLWFLALAFVQRRFAIQLGLFLSVFAAIGFVAFAYWLALVLPPVLLRDDPVSMDQQTLELPDRRRLVLLGGLGAVGIGSGTLFSEYILSQIAIEDDAYAAAAWMRDYAAERDWTYPRNYVLAYWGRVRMYNYFVNGQSREYSYARQNYNQFIFDHDAASWYERFKGRVGFVVTRDVIDAGRLQIHAQLHDDYGSAKGPNDGIGHLRAVWESENGSTKVFTLVPGATVTGEASPETIISLSTSIDVAGTGRTIRYERHVETDSDGRFSVVLAHPGEYEVGADGTVLVDEAAVLNGDEQTVDL
jgi:dolichyl-diphosphooligosaccharide--protein glycosyltransferase